VETVGLCAIRGGLQANRDILAEISLLIHFSQRLGAVGSFQGVAEMRNRCVRGKLCKLCGRDLRAASAATVNNS
jgi:hypothetical protein